MFSVALGTGVVARVRGVIRIWEAESTLLPRVNLITRRDGAGITANRPGVFSAAVVEARGRIVCSRKPTTADSGAKVIFVSLPNEVP